MISSRRPAEPDQILQGAIFPSRYGWVERIASRLAWLVVREPCKSASQSFRGSCSSPVRCVGVVLPAIVHARSASSAVCMQCVEDSKSTKDARY